MIILGKTDDTPIAVSIKPNCLTISFELDAHTDVFSFDYEGRFWTALIDQVSYRRGLDGKIVAKWVNAKQERVRRWIVGEEADAVCEIARCRAEELQASIAQGRTDLSGSLPPEGVSGLSAAAAFNQTKRKEDQAHFNEIYLPVGILPPDQYGAVVLQATEGCSFNACTFCDFYKKRPFRIKTPQQYNQHCIKVKNFLGKGLSLRRTIFIGDANALVLSTAKLIELFEITHSHFNVSQLGGMFAFLDGISGERKTAKDYRVLANYGLERVYIGLESGSDQLLSFLNKPSKANDVIRAVNTMKKGGVAVGVIVLLGAGGKTYQTDHINETIKTLNNMMLDMNDIIYFSELVEREGLAYTAKAFRNDLGPLTALERSQQGQQIESALRFSKKHGTPHLSRYDIREFVY